MATNRGIARLGVDWVRLWGGTALSILFLVLAFRGIDFANLWDTLAQTNYGLVFVAVGTIIVTSMAKTARWQLLFYPHHRQRRYRKLLAIIFIGQMVNIVIPARLGELTRAYLVGEIEGESKALVLGTIAVEKAVDLLMVLFLFVGLLLTMTIPRWVQEPGVGVAMVTLVFLGILALLAHHKERLLSAFGRLLGTLPELTQARLMEHLEAALDSLEVLRSSSGFWQPRPITLPFWLCAFTYPSWQRFSCWSSSKWGWPSHPRRERWGCFTIYAFWPSPSSAWSEARR
jgi:uncharacterized protein (TIRG00374 family)